MAGHPKIHGRKVRVAGAALLGMRVEKICGGLF